MIDLDQVGAEVAMLVKEREDTRDELLAGQGTLRGLLPAVRSESGAEAHFVIAGQGGKTVQSVGIPPDYVVDGVRYTCRGALRFSGLNGQRPEPPDHPAPRAKTKRAKRSAARKPIVVPPNAEYLTRPQAGVFLGYDEEKADEAVRGLMRRGRLRLGTHYFKPTEHVLRFKRSALESWLTSSARAEPEAQTEVSKEELRELLAEAAQQLAKEGSR